MNRLSEQCIDICELCAALCQQTIEYCELSDGKLGQPLPLLLIEDCMEICDLNARFLKRGSRFHKQLAGLCADIAEKCAKTCESFQDDKQMLECARVCRECEMSCRKMIDD